jgi:hypothetical protein
MSDTVKVVRARGEGVVKIKNEPLGDAAVKNIQKILVPESIATVTGYGGEYGFRTSVVEFTKGANLVTRAGVSDDGYGSLKLATFPKGRIWIHGAVGTLSSVDVSGSANISDTGSGDYSFGTVATANTTLDGTAVNLGPSAALVDPFVSGVGAAATSSVLAAGALFDGSSIAIPIYLNMAFDAGDVTTGDGTADLAGKITIQWSYLSDY